MTGSAWERVAAALRDRREAALLALPSVRHTAELLAGRCRELSWVRAAVTTLDRFVVVIGVDDLEALLAAGRRDPRCAEGALRRFAAALDGRAPEQVAALAFGPKVWWRTNGVAVTWRPLTPRPSVATPAGLRTASALPTLALIGSGLTSEELAALRLGDLGSLDHQARLLPDPLSDPLAVRYRDGQDGREWVTFLSTAAREAVLARIAGLPGGSTADAPLVRPADLTAARARDRALIDAGNDVNVALCRSTGDFFRSWGMPGARFDQRSTRTTHPERRQV